MKILMIQPWIKHGGAETDSLYVADELEKRGHSVSIRTLFKDLRAVPEHLRGVKVESEKGLWAKVFKNSKFCLYFFGPWLLGWRVIKEARNYDFLYPQNLPSHWLAVLAGKLYGKPVVWQCNEPLEALPFRRVKEIGLCDWLMWFLGSRFWDRWLAKSIDQIIVPSKICQKEVRRIYKREAQIINLGVDCDFFSKRSKKTLEKIKKRWGLEKKFVLLMAGKLHPQKNQGFALQVLKRLSVKIPEAVLALAGEGPLRRILELEIKKLGLEKKVILTGFLKASEMRVWYQLADLILYPSKEVSKKMNQSWGLVPIEALCQGKVSVVSPKCGVGEFLKQYQIGFIEELRVEDFADRVLMLYKRKKGIKKMALKGKRLVKEKLNWSNYTKETEKVFLKVQW